MRLIADLHTHTTYSHGKGSIAEMAAQARTLGLDQLVISDHGSGHPFFGVRRGKFAEMRREVDRLNALYDDLDIFLSVEANVIGADGSIDVGDEELTHCDFIYAGYHYGYIPASVGDVFGFSLRNYATRLFSGMTEKTRAINTRAYLAMMDRYELRMITHPGDKLPLDIDAVAKKAAQKGVILEINPRHGHLSVEEIKTAMAYDVKFAINSDAHTVANLGNIYNAEEIVAAAGLPLSRIVNVTA